MSDEPEAEAEVPETEPIEPEAINPVNPNVDPTGGEVEAEAEDEPEDEPADE